MRTVIADCRFAVRLYVATPYASLVLVTILAVATAFAGAFLSLYVDLSLRPHPGFAESGRIATVGRNGNGSLLGLPFEITQRLADDMVTVDSAVASSVTNVLIGEELERVPLEMVSRNFFDGMRPLLAIGRGFLTEEHTIAANPVAIISYRFWQQRFGGDPNVLGTVIDVSRDPEVPYWQVANSPFTQGAAHFVTPGRPEQETTQFRIVGVMAESLGGFAHPETMLFAPLERALSLFVGSPDLLARLSPPTFVRRAAGMSIEAVVTELEGRFGRELSENYPFSGSRLDGIDGIVLDMSVKRDATRQLKHFLGGSILLALTAAANVSLFLLARAPGRRRELGIRMAVGAPRRRLARQLATEAGLMVIAATVLGLVLSIWLNLYLRGLAFLNEAEWRNVTLLDWRVFSLFGILAVCLTLFVSLAPVLDIMRHSIAAASRQVVARPSLAQILAGTAQIAIASVIGAAAVSSGWYLSSLIFGHPGYETTDRYLAQYDLNRSGVDFSVEGAFLETARRREAIEAIPGIEAVAFGRPVPGDEQRYISGSQFTDPDDPANPIEGRVGMIDSRFVDVTGLRLLSGRTLADNDVGVLVNQTMARALWGREDVIGQQLPASSNLRGEPEVIGVLEDLSFGHPSANVHAYVFTAGINPSYGTMVIQSDLTIAELQQQLDRLTTEGAIDIYVTGIQTLDAVRNGLIAADRGRGFLTITATTLVVILAVFGFHGTQRFLVTAGRREYAIHAALGAGPRALGTLVTRRGLASSLPGLVLGGLLAFIVLSYLSDDRVARGSSPTIITLLVMFGLTLILLAATIGPARQAKSVEPAQLLNDV
jgi:ABC-type antimicrobial peptide transport system permease subunit